MLKEWARGGARGPPGQRRAVHLGVGCGVLGLSGFGELGGGGGGMRTRTRGRRPRSGRVRARRPAAQHAHAAPAPASGAAAPEPTAPGNRAHRPIRRRRSPRIHRSSLLVGWGGVARPFLAGLRNPGLRQTSQLRPSGPGEGGVGAGWREVERMTRRSHRLAGAAMGVGLEGIVFAQDGGLWADLGRSRGKHGAAAHHCDQSS